jgi:hypothetical protein
MKLKHVCAVAGVALFAIPVSGAVAGNGDKATGGGQVLFSDGDVKASTIAFTAQGTTDDAKGQVQFVDRSEGTGQDAVKYHGVVDCIEVTGNLAVIGGFRKKGDPMDEEDRFVLRVQDNGEPNQGQDMIQFDSETDAADLCGDDDMDDTEPEFSLARGNAQVRDGDSSNPAESSSMMSFKKALRLGGLR